MKGKENTKNFWRCMLVGVFVVSLFAAFTTEGLALNPQPLPPGYHVSPMMTTPFEKPPAPCLDQSVAVSMFNLEPPDPCLVCRKSVSSIRNEEGF